MIQLQENLHEQLLGQLLGRSLKSAVLIEG
jgi:hypothetical protein